MTVAKIKGGVKIGNFYQSKKTKDIVEVVDYGFEEYCGELKPTVKYRVEGQIGEKFLDDFIDLMN